MLELVDFLRNNTVAFKNSVLISSAASIGVRESRKLKGEHILTAEELKNLIGGAKMRGETIAAVAKGKDMADGMPLFFEVTAQEAVF